MVTVTQPVEGVELTPKMAAVIKTFLEDPQQSRYGFELMQVTGQPSGTLYPILARLERAGWLIGAKETVDPSSVGRPSRYFYRIAGAAIPVARLQLAALSERYRPPTRLRPRLARPDGAT